MKNKKSKTRYRVKRMPSFVAVVDTQHGSYNPYSRLRENSACCVYLWPGRFDSKRNNWMVTATQFRLAVDTAKFLNCNKPASRIASS